MANTYKEKMRNTNESLSKIQEGQGSKFDSGVASLERMHSEMMKANFHSADYSIQGLRSWLASLKSLERELYPYLSKDDREELEKTRVKNQPNSKTHIGNFFTKLDKYDKTLRVLHASKGFGLNNNSSDIGSALEEDMF